MRDPKEINGVVLRKCLKILNNCKVLGVYIDFFGMNKEEMIKSFAYEIEHLPEYKQNKIPQAVVEFYNWMFEDEGDVKVQFRHIPYISKFGSREGTQMYIIDLMLIEGGHTWEEIARACNATKERVRSHMNSLRRRYGVKIWRERDKYYLRDMRDEVKEEGKIAKGFLDE